jgi:hypothetical protein
VTLANPAADPPAWPTGSPEPSTRLLCESVEVNKGTFLVSMGDTLDLAKTRP